MPGQRARGGLALLRADDAALRARSSATPGTGRVARALACGVPVVACPHAGDMAENAARIRWAGLGVSLPRRFQTARGVRLAVRRLLSDPGYAVRTAELRRWAARHDGAAAAADAVEELARRPAAD